MRGWMPAQGRTWRGPSVPDVVESARLLLRPLSESQEHQALYRALYGDSAVMRLVGEAVPDERMEASFAVSLDHSTSARTFATRWCVHVRQNGQGVGLLGANLHPASDSVEVGVLLLPAVHGHGYAQEALAALMTTLAGRDGVSGFWSRHQAANVRMARVLERLGFARTQQETGWCRWERPAGTGLMR